MTNYEQLASTPERLATFLTELCACPPHKSVADAFCVKRRKGEYTCPDCWYEWLEQGADE